MVSSPLFKLDYAPPRCDPLFKPEFTRLPSRPLPPSALRIPCRPFSLSSCANSNHIGGCLCCSLPEQVFIAPCPLLIHALLSLFLPLHVATLLDHDTLSSPFIKIPLIFSFWLTERHTSNNHSIHHFVFTMVKTM